MNFGFEVAHGYNILKGYLSAKDKEMAINKIKNQDWDDIIDEYETEELTKGYDIVDIWEIE